MQMHLLELVVAILHSIAAQNVRIHQVLFDKFHCERDFGLADEFCCTSLARRCQAFYSQVCPSLIQ